MRGMLPRFLRSTYFFKIQSQKFSPRAIHKLRKFLSTRPAHVLVVRPDRLGDVILSTPVLEVIKKRYPRAKLTFLVRETVAPVLRGLSSVNEVMVYDPDGRHRGFKGFWNLVADLKKNRFQFAITLQSHWRIAAATYFAGITYRIGPVSKVHSYLFYNLGIRQRRSQVEMHEADYNLELLKKIGIHVSTRTVPTQVHLSNEQVSLAKEWLENRGWRVDGGSTIVIHPGMGGSALNWPETHYCELARGLVQEGFQVVVTGGPTERALLDQVEKSISPFLGDAPGRLIFFRNTDGHTVDFLAGIYSCARLVVAPSTGPLHLAVALHIPVVTFFPPIRVQSVIRWGPYLADDSRASILVPEVYCGQDFKCLGTPCHYYPCMKSLTVKQAMEQVSLQLRQNAPHPSRDRISSD